MVLELLLFFPIFSFYVPRCFVYPHTLLPFEAPAGSTFFFHISCVPFQEFSFPYLADLMDTHQPLFSLPLYRTRPISGTMLRHTLHFAFLRTNAPP